MNSQNNASALQPSANTRFKKGQSGNPKGRPKKIAKELDLGKSLQAVDNELIPIAIDGKTVWITKAEVQIRQLFTRAIRGNLAAAKATFAMASEYFAPEAAGPQQIVFRPTRKRSKPRVIN
ncbi:MULTISPECIES: DUF5681 domain-containing protein [unclassified Bradyrhizobium]